MKNEEDRTSGVTACPGGKKSRHKGVKVYNIELDADQQAFTCPIDWKLVN